MFDKAVLIGIQNYTKSNFGSLDGPEQDIFNIEKIIKKNKKNAKIVFTPRIESRSQFQILFSPQGIKNGS